MKILLFTQARALGDGIISSGFPKEIRSRYPEAVIDIFSTRSYASAFKDNPFVNKIYYFTTYKTFWRNVPVEKIWQNSLLHLPKLLKARNENYDMIVDITSLSNKSNHSMIKILNKNAKTVCFTLQKTDDKHMKSLKKVYTDIFTKIDSYLIFGIDFMPKYDIYINDAKIKKAENYFKSMVADRKNRKIIIFNGDGSGFRSISDIKIIETVKKLLCANEKFYIFFLGFKPCLKKYIKIHKAINSERVNITYETDLFDTAALIKLADILISVDTSLIHIASATGTNVVDIYSQNIPKYSPCFPKFVDFIAIKQTKNLHKLDMDGYDDEEVCEAAKILLNKPHKKNLS